MPKYLLQWKDPDFVDAKSGEPVCDIVHNKEYQKLRELGIGEYLIVEFDTDAMTTSVVSRRR